MSKNTTPKEDLINVQIGERIRELRMFRGFTRKQLSAKVGVTHQQIHKYETGVNRISAGKIFIFAEALNCSPSLFYDKTPHTAPNVNRTCGLIAVSAAECSSANQELALRLVSALGDGEKQNKTTEERL